MIEQRKYSIAEIDQMRANLIFICRDADLGENQLRTYMLNGTEPEELCWACFEEMQRRLEKAKYNRERLRAVTNNDPRWVA